MICITPDQSVRGHLLSKYMIKNNEELLESFLECLNNSKGIKINYKRFKNSGSGGKDNNRKHNTGYLFKLFNKFTICWDTKK